jgi:hypothetical protein
LTARFQAKFAAAFFVVLYLWTGGALGAGAPQAAVQQQSQAKVELRPVRSKPGYETATAPGALRFACSSDVAALESWFAGHSLPFVGSLVKKQGRQSCHLFYEPTAPGFRAAPENFEVKELFFDVETLSFLTLRDDRFGDALDITKTILEKVKRPLDVTIGVALTQNREIYSRALAFHFPQTHHRIRLRNYTIESNNPWVQDYLKAGRVGDKEKILVTRRLFEGRALDGELFRPMLDQLTEERFVRSKLSWEGGDLQFVSDPRDPARTILFYGESARGYWGDALSQAEYEYVLRLEFGADEAVDLSKLTPHVDYFVAFLARENIALVSQPETENFDIIRAALDVLVKHYHPLVPAEVTELSTLFSDRERAFGDKLGTVRKLVGQAKKSSPRWPQIEDGRLAHDLSQYVTSNCADNPADCLIGDSLSRLLHTNLPLARRWITAALRGRSDGQLIARLLSVIESQLPGFRIETQPRIDAAVASLERMGFQVIRLPRIGGDRSLEVPWSGISYANAVLIGKQFFVPEFGLGKAEQTFFENLRAELPSSYEVVPVYARHMMLFNGGTHCVTAMVREAPETATGR